MTNRSKSIAAALLLGFGLAAGPAAAADDKIDRIKSAGVLRVCAVDYAPLIQKDPRTNEYQGLYADLSVKLAEVLAVELEYVESSWRTFVQNIVTDKCDFSIAPSYPTAARAVEVMFTDGISEDGQAVWVREEAGYTSIEEIDVPGKVVAVRAGSSNEKYARLMFSQAEIRLIVSDVQPATLMELATGRVDAAVIAVMSAMNVIENNPNITGVTRVGELVAPSHIAWAVPRGEYHFLHFLNVFLADMETSGEMEVLRAKWLSD